MARTKLVARVIQNQLRRANQRRPNPKRPRSGVKTIEGRIGNGDIKIKLIPQPKNIQDKKKKHWQVVRRCSKARHYLHCRTEKCEMLIFI